MYDLNLYDVTATPIVIINTCSGVFPGILETKRSNISSSVGHYGL